jgi:pimeloyl-ACP methyl ester carboxylesterase
MEQLTPDRPAASDPGDHELPRHPCPAPARLREEAARYDAEAEVGRWNGPRYRMTYRILGQGPPLFLVPGIASTYQVYALLLNQLAGRFRTVLYDYPGEHQGDGANLPRITHDDLVDDLFGLIDHLNIGRIYLAGLSFGSTVVLKTLCREPRRFPKAAVQGAFAHRDFTRVERWALRLGRLFPGKVERLPLRRAVLNYNNRAEFPAILQDRWSFYIEKNGQTPIRSLAHRVKLLTELDLRPILPEVSTEILLLQGNEDRIVHRSDFELLKAALPRAEGVIMPTVGHQPHLTHAEVLARLIGDWLLPCAPSGCSELQSSRPRSETESSGSQARVD